MEKEKKKSKSTVEKSDKLYLVQAIKVNISTMINLILCALDSMP